MQIFSEIDILRRFERSAFFVFWEVFWYDGGRYVTSNS